MSRGHWNRSLRPRPVGRTLTVAHIWDLGLQGLSDGGGRGGFPRKKHRSSWERASPPGEVWARHQREQQRPGRDAWETAPHRSAFKNKPWWDIFSFSYRSWLVPSEDADGSVVHFALWCHPYKAPPLTAQGHLSAAGLPSSHRAWVPCKVHWALPTGQEGPEAQWGFSFPCGEDLTSPTASWSPLWILLTFLP